MHARLTTVRVQPGKIEETLDIGRNSIVPAAKKRQGFEGLFLLTNFDTGKVISLTLWETEEDLNASEESGYYQEQLGKLAEVLAEQPEKEDYEVSIQV